MTTITTPPTRIEQTNPLLAEIRACSAKEFTGSIVAEHQGVEVLVWLEDGALVAVHSPSYRAPLAELVERLTGHRPTDRDNPLFEAYQNGWMSPDQVDAAVRDFAYGLLASALTWRRPRIRRNRKVRVDREKFLPGQEAPWQRVVTDVTSRVDELVASWAVITEALAREEMAPRTAAYACTQLVVTVPSHPLLRTGLPIDAAARALGTTRQVMLREIARVILRGHEKPQFERVEPIGPGPGDGFLVPEGLEAPETQWASVEATAQVDVSAVELGAPVADETEGDPLGFLAPLAGDDPFAAAAVDAVTPWPSIADSVPSGPAPWQPLEDDHGADAAAEAYGVPSQMRPDPEDARDGYPPAVPVEEISSLLQSEPVPPAPVAPYVPEANPLTTWVSAAPDDTERAVRRDVVALAAKAAVATASEKVDQVEHAFVRVRSEGDGLVQAVQALPAAQAALEAAQRAADEAGDALARAKAAAAESIERVRAADEYADAVGSEAERAAQAMEDARSAYEAARQRANTATEAAAAAEHEAAAAHRELETGDGVLVAVAEAERTRVEHEQVEPARRALLAAIEARTDHEMAAAAAQSLLEAAGAAAGVALRVLTSDWPTPPDGADEAAKRLEMVHQQVNDYYANVNRVLTGVATPGPFEGATPLVQPGPEPAVDWSDDELRALDALASAPQPILPTQADSPTETWRPGQDASPAFEQSAGAELI